VNPDIQLAPILLFVYNRPEHTKLLIESLKLNPDAKKSILYIFSDAPKSQSASRNVENVREFISGITGFKEIIISRAETNKGLANSIITGVTKVLKAHKKVIVLEDDLILSPNFLKYMNEALGKYESKENIFSVSGYCPPASFPKTFKEEVFLYPRVSSWGWATWENRWLLADWNITDFEGFRKSKSQQKAFNTAGEDRTPMLVKQQFGYINSWAIRFDYAGFKQNKMTLYPRISKTANNGADGSGEHVGATSRFNVELDNKNTFSSLPENPKEYIEVTNLLKKTYEKSLVRKVINYFLVRFPQSFFAKL